MIFVDTNVFVYAVGRDHPLRESAREVFHRPMTGSGLLVTSSEVLQELLHIYLPVNRFEALDAALLLAESTMSSIWSIEQEDVRLARLLADQYQGLGARDLLHLACCRRREVQEIKTFDRALSAAFGRRSRPPRDPHP